MKTILFLVITYALLAGVFSTSGVNSFLDQMKGKPHKEIFKSYHYLYEKKYQINSQEALKRYRNFKKNLKWIEEENRKSGEELYGINQFTDLTFEEYKNRLMNPEVMRKAIEEMKNKSLRFLHEDNNNHQHHHHHQDEGKTKPIDENLNLKQQQHVDWRNWDGPVKNQESCGSCWAFAAVASIEILYNKLKGKFTPFSEQYLVDCDNLDYGCEGGWPTETITWLNTNGLLHAEDAPYKGVKQTCNTNLKQYEYKIVKNYQMTNENLVSSFEPLIRKGPLIAAMDSSFPEFMNYRPSSLLPLVKDWNQELNHAVTVVAQTVENGNVYLIVKNSWGTDWGFNGYFKVPFNKSLGMTSYSFLPGVYDGAVPQSHPPGPEPPKPLDCVEIFDKDFTTQPLRRICDSFAYLDWDLDIFYGGVRYPLTTVNPPTLRLFSQYNCVSMNESNPSENIRINQTTEKPTINGSVQRSLSMAFEKNSEPGCISFWTYPCLEGNSEFSVCNDIHDSTGVNLSNLVNVWSMVADQSTIASVVFFDKPNYEGNAITFENNTKVFNISILERIETLFRTNEGVRSIRIVRK
jgi:hypothetical protein